MANRNASDGEAGHCLCADPSAVRGNGQRGRYCAACGRSLHRCDSLRSRAPHAKSGTTPHRAREIRDEDLAGQRCPSDAPLELGEVANRVRRTSQGTCADRAALQHEPTPPSPPSARAHEPVCAANPPAAFGRRSGRAMLDRGRYGRLRRHHRVHEAVRAARAQGARGRRADCRGRSATASSRSSRSPTTTAEACSSSVAMHCSCGSPPRTTPHVRAAPRS